MDERLDRALEFAAWAHGGAYDRGGEPAILHPLRVFRAMQRDGYDEAHLAVAVLHDVIEDSTLVPLERIAADLGPEIAAAVDAISRRPHPAETYREYIERVGADRIARAVKRYDLADNLAPRRLERLPEGERKGLAARYERALIRLADLTSEAHVYGARRREEG